MTSPTPREPNLTPRAFRVSRLALIALLALPRLGLAQTPDAEDGRKKARPGLGKPGAPGKLKLKKGPAFPEKPSLAAPAKGANQPTEGPKLIGQPETRAKPKPPEDEVGDTVITAPGDDEPGFADIKKTKGTGCRPMRADARVTFDFKGDINELVTTIAKITCKNFIVTNKVRSQKFEIISPTAITVEEAWRAFLSSLEANEFTIFQVGRYYKIIQSTDGTRAPVPIYQDGQEMPVNDRMVTKIYKLKHAADINAVVNYLNIFKSGKGQIHPFAPTNTIIATDFGTSIERIERIFAEIDQPGALEQVHVVPVEFASAQEIADKLSQVFEPQKTGAAKSAAAPGRIKMREAGGAPGGEGGPAPAAGNEDSEDQVSVSKILADERTNKLIIIASERSFKQIMALKKELDIPDTGSDSQIQVLRLKHADAEELSSTLASLAQGKPTTPRGGKPLGKNAKGGAGAAAQPVAAGGAVAAGASLFQGEVKITADKPTNSLLITASKGDFNSVKRVIELLDVARFQVFVEAVILEVSVKRDRQLGFTWHGGISPVIDGKNSPILFGNQPTQNFNSLTLSTNPLLLAGILGFAGAARGPTLEGSESIIQGGIPSVGVVIQALQSTNDVNVISTPHLLTLDNEEAEIQVSEKRPFPSGLTLGGLGGLSGLAGQAGGASALGSLGGLGLGSLSFNREDVGLTLKLKPQISDEDNVRLQIDQELSDVAGTDAVTGQTITSKRSAKTVVVVRSQDSVVIGGLVRDRETIDESKVPLFGEIPLLGWLFKRQVKGNEKVNLLLVLTPYIIRGPQDFRAIFERKMAERKEFVDRFHGVAKEFEAEIDWTRKKGPVAAYRAAIRKELLKAENDGPGGPDEDIIRPPSDEATTTIPAPTQGGDAPLEQTPPIDAPSEPERQDPEL